MSETQLRALVDVPLDPILRDMKRGRPYVLGLGRATPVPVSESEPWTTRVATALRGRSGRRTLFLETETQEESSFKRESYDPASGVTQAHWPVRFDGNRKVLRDLAVFPKWKEDFSLIVVHLGAVDSSAFGGLGKLCDGIAIAADMAQVQRSSLRRLERCLRQHERHGCRIVGMWSIEIG